MQRSQTHRETSRKNGRNSRGPVTPEGKHNSSGNNTTHGLFARLILIDGESRTIFNRLVDSLIDEHQPETATEFVLVQKLAASHWRLQRAWAIEAAGFSREMKLQADSLPAESHHSRASLAFTALANKGRQLDLMNRYQRTFDRESYRALAALQHLKVQKNAGTTRSLECAENKPLSEIGCPGNDPAKPGKQPEETRESGSTPPEPGRLPATGQPINVKARNNATQSEENQQHKKIRNGTKTHRKPTRSLRKPTPRHRTLQPRIRQRTAEYGQPEPCYLCPRVSMRRSLAFSSIFVLSSGLAFPQALFQKPIKYLGDSDFLATAANPLAFQSTGPNWIDGRELNNPKAIALDTSVSPPIVYIADSGNNRVLGFRYATQLVAGAVADIVIGQVNLYANQPQNPANGGRQTGLSNPTGLAVDSVGNLYVADAGNNRILRFPQPFAPANVNQFPSLVIGQKGYSTSTANLNGIGASTLFLNSGTTGRMGIAFDATGNLWVADRGNNRVLRFPATTLATGANFPAADLVIGQPDFVSSGNAGNSNASRSTLTGLTNPEAVSLDSSGNLFVVDQLFRTVVYNAPLATGQTANMLFGVDPSAANPASATQIALNSPVGVLASASGPIVADTGNNRLMLFAAQSKWQGTSPSANAVIGQPSYVVNQVNQGNVDASATTLSSPSDLAATLTELFVVDTGNNRVLVYPATAAGGFSPTASRVIGQLDFPFNGANLVDGKGFSFATGYPAGAVLDNSVTPARLYVADTLNNRILGYKDFTHLQNGQQPDLVIGQPDFNRNIVNYPSGLASTPGATGLSVPTALAVDAAGNLFVADSGNSRILRFPAPFASGKTALEPADLVLGQQSFTSAITDPTPLTLNLPVGLALTSAAFKGGTPGGGWLVVADSAQNRVLLFPAPFVSGESATVVLGQYNFNVAASGSGTSALSSPRGVAVDPQDRVIVTDTGNARVQIYDVAANLSNGAPASISLAGYFSAPLSPSVGPNGDFWIADSSAGRFVHFASVANLPLSNDTPDVALSVLSPHSGFVDAFNNLLVTDGLNRVLYFAPQISFTNAANYSTRALAAGTVAAIFPTVTTNSIANGTATATANQFPLPTTLSDTQVTVGGTPAPLLFVSPGQNNVIMPQSLGTSGTADLLAIRPSTGQILGGAEVPLAPASPGLFTQAALGSGQLLAVNLQDASINNAAHPVVRGQYVILYGTGVGPVSGPPADGAAASGQPASDFPTVLIASSGTTTTTGGVTTTLPAFVPASVNFSGLAPGYAGLWQINVQIPLTAQSGSAVVIKVYEKDIPNLDQSSALTTTIAVR